MSTEAPAGSQPLIRASDLTYRAGARTIIDRVDLSVSRGEIVTVIGPNGSGKTTLMRLLLGLIKPAGGTIERADGLTLGYLPQRFNTDPTIPLTVARFLALTRSVPVDKIADALAEVGAARLAQAQVSQLSGGEFQRVALARALIADPDLLVLDEPVQNVDHAGEAELYALIGSIRDRRGCGILLVSHDLHVVMAASDRVVCLNHHICCSGIPQSVSKDPEYLRLFGPKAGEIYAIYAHDHDHVHDLSGEVSDRHDH